MAEGDNFEDDLFADLYADDDDTSKATQQPQIVDTKPQPVPTNGGPVAGTEESTNGAQNIADDHQDYKNEHEDDDDIDFNVGNGKNYDTPPVQNEQSYGIGNKEDGKMFIGGLNWETTDESLKEYFSQFGEVIECTVMRDGLTGRSRGFGFLTFKDPRTVNTVMVKEHYLDGKIVRPDFQTPVKSLRIYPSKLASSEAKARKDNRSHFQLKIDPKRAIPRDEQERTSKIFVGGVSQEATEQDFKEYFTQFGRVVDATLMMDKDTGRPRGFGFVTFDSEAAVDNCLNVPLAILGKPIEVKKAQPRGNMREEEEANARGGRNRFRKGGDDNRNDNFSSQQQQGSGAGQIAPGGMTPQVMAQYWQRMQQYFAMMQQQMAMSGARQGMGQMNPQMNPQMMAQMAQMQQMQQMQQMMQMQQQNQAGRSGSADPQDASMAGMQMNPQMLAQMQQMQQMQAMAGAQGMGNNFGAGGGGGNAGGRNGTPGFNAYEQQIFEQQKFEQQQQRRPQRDQSQQYSQGNNFNANGGPAPTSWEGMYDDVPQPGQQNQGGAGRGGQHRGGSQGAGSATPSGGPQAAPPANAPTGPKNAGRPGANYRGGGRGGQRGFHPYARGS